MLRREAIASVERIGKAAMGAKWLLVGGTVRAKLEAMPEAELHHLARTVLAEADRLRGLVR